MSLIMPTFNRKEQTALCVSAALDAVASWPDASLVVVDNGSTDGTYETLKAVNSDKLILLQFKGVGISALRNSGAEATESAVLCFVDSDCIVPKDYLSRTNAVLLETSADAVGAMYALPSDAHWIERTWMSLNCPPREGPTKLLPGGALSIRRATFQEVGGFSTDFETGEDSDLCERVLKRGGSIYESSSLAVVHLRNMSSLHGFFKKQLWHSKGAVQQTKRIPLDRTTVMSAIHYGLTLLAVTLPLFLDSTVTTALLAIGCLVAMPVLAVTYRVMFRGGAFLPLPSTLLYAAYLYARGAGIVQAIRLR